MASKNTLLLVGGGAIASIIGYGLYQDYKQKQAAAEKAEAEAAVAKAEANRLAVHAAQQEALGKQILAEAQAGSEQEAKGYAILATAQALKGKQQEQLGKAIQQAAVAQYARDTANVATSQAVSTAAAKGVPLTSQQLYQQYNTDNTKRNIVMVGGVMLVAVTAWMAYSKRGSLRAA